LLLRKSLARGARLVPPPLPRRFRRDAGYRRFSFHRSNIRPEITPPSSTPVEPLSGRLAGGGGTACAVAAKPRHIAAMTALTNRGELFFMIASLSEILLTVLLFYFA
jgi:hypothetical protein